MNAGNTSGSDTILWASDQINWWVRSEDWALDWTQGVYKHQTGQPLFETPHRELTDLPGIKLTEMFNW